MPDVFEVRYGLNPQNSDDAGYDSDKDGISNLNEYLAGTDPNTRNPPMISLEEPVLGEIHTGVGNLRGWAVSGTAIERVEIYIDDEYAYNAPYGGDRADVAAAFPHLDGSKSSGFSLAFNYSNLTAGTHEITAIAVDDAGVRAESSANFEVVRFDSSFISDLEAIDLSGGSCALAGDEISLDNVQVDGSRYDLLLKWRRAEQGFETIKISGAATTSASLRQTLEADTQSTVKSQAQSVFEINLEEPVLNEIHTGVGNLRGWAVAEDGVDRIEIYIDGSYEFNAPYGGERIDIRNAFPDVSGSEKSGFSLAFNYSNLSGGLHTIKAIAYSSSGETKESSTTFSVVRFDSSFIVDPNAVDLTGGRCSLEGDQMMLSDINVDSRLHDVTLRWRRAEQGFEIVEIR